MQRGHTLEFECQECQEAVRFSILEIEKKPQIGCTKCGKQYRFEDPTLLRQLRKFEALCRQIRESEEILSTSSVGIDVGSQKVQIPFKLLLTRLSSYLDLNMNGKSLKIGFRFEPLSDIPQEGPSHAK